MTRQIGFALLAFAALAVFAHGRTDSSQVCVEGTCYPRRAAVGDSDIPLRGAALLRFWGFHVYTAAYYEGTPAENQPPPRRLQLNYLRTIPAKDIVKATEKGIEKNPNVKRADIADRLDLLYSAYVDVKKGDTYEIVYTPGAGTAVSFNGELKVTIPGEDFADAFLGIWVGEHALSDSLRRRLTAG